MSEYVNLKLHNGVDLLGVLDYDTDELISLSNPIQIEVHPEQGLFAKSYLMLSEENTVVFHRADVLHFAKANERASKYYDEFVRQLSESDPMQSDDEYLDDVENMFEELLTSKLSTKH